MSIRKNQISLDKYEQEILDAFENGKLHPTPSQDDYQVVARNTLEKSRQVSIQLAENDYLAYKRKASREGIPYQILIQSILHKYISGFIKEAYPK